MRGQPRHLGLRRPAGTPTTHTHSRLSSIIRYDPFRSIISAHVPVSHAACPLSCGLACVQLNGFLINTGRTPVCNLRLKPVTSSRVLSFWPDWAEGATWQVFFNPNQVTAVGESATHAVPSAAIDV